MPVLDPENLDATLRPWLLRHLCPFWLDRVRDPRGGFFEELDEDGLPLREEKRTSLVQARLTYVFSHAYVLGGDPAFRDAAEHGLAFLDRSFRAADRGWHRSANVNGRVLDAARDCYDQAFVLFALAWLHRATKDVAALRLAEETYDFMTAHLADECHGGFYEEYVPDKDSTRLPRRQNPHMHLLEAVLALSVATGSEHWLERASYLIELFKRRFVDAHTGALIEFFSEDWSPAPGAQGTWREPGHQFEWVWLLFEFHRATGDPTVIEYAERLFQFGTRYGIERGDTLRGAVFDGVDASGTVLAPTKLLWPQTEFIKACLSRHEWLRDPGAWPTIRTHVALIVQHFLRSDGASWANQLARNGAPTVTRTPARVLYHLFLAMAEAERVRPEMALPVQR